MAETLLAMLLTALLYLGGPGARGPAAQDPASAFHVETCDASMWDHVYHGTFTTAKDR